MSTAGCWTLGHSRSNLATTGSPSAEIASANLMERVPAGTAQGQLRVTS
jgi:hypothetical protein